MRRVAAVALPLLVVLALTIWRGRGPSPRPLNAPEREFSSARAMAVLRELLAEGTPHPVGTPANARVRDRIVARFRSLGYATTVQRRFACSAAPNCAMVENIVARAPGASRKAVMLAAHYDSVPSGPGASDDGAGVAALLEVARAIRGEQLRNPIVFSITDAEEVGLLGAEGFVADEALTRGVAVVVNVENRGTRGLSNMFETSANNRWLVRRLAQSLDYPAATSFSSTVYELLPNDTDVTVFKRAGMATLNFAAIGAPQRYHTPLDNLANLSERMLQHHGQNALAIARALADADLDASMNDDATFFDVANFFIVWWPASTTVWLALASLVALMIGARKTNARAMTFGVLATFTAMLLCVLGALGLAWIIALGNEGMRWAAHPHAAVAAMWLVALAAPLWSAAVFGKRTEERALVFGAAIVWHAVAIALALTLPGISYLFLVPAMAASIAALAGVNDTAVGAISSTVGAVVLFPLGLVLYDALGEAMLAAIAIFLVVIGTLIAPLFARMRNAVIVTALAIVCAIVAALLPAVTREHPRHVIVSYIDDDVTSPAFYASDALPGLTRASTKHTPWRQVGAWTMPAPRQDLPRVQLHAERRGNQVIVRIASQRNANELALIYRGGTIARVNGVVPPPRPARFRRNQGEWKFFNAAAVTEVTIEMNATGPVDLVASDVTYGMPAAAAKLVATRDASPAVPVHDGDVTLTRTRLTR